MCQRTRNVFRRLCLLIPLLLVTSCDKKESNPVDSGTPNTPVTGGKISTGQSVDLGSQTIGTSGGTFTINKSGDPLNGFQITVPANGFTQPQTFAVTYAPIVTHQLGSFINPASPLITITYGGGYSADNMDVKVPIKLPAGCFAMGFFFDAATGDLTPIPVVRLDSASITITARTLLSTGSQLGKGLWKTKNLASATMFISYILKSVLGTQTVVSTGFTPGVDDWEFPNYGSYIAPHGHCTGQSATAIWYYYAHKLKGDPPLFHQFDKMNNPLNPGHFWWDNPRGYRFASTIQEDINWDSWAKSMDRQYPAPDMVFDAFVYSMLVTGRPQMLFLLNSAGRGGHAVIAYKVDVFLGKVYVADPNYPGNRDADGTPVTRIVTYVPGFLTGSFKPYSSAAHVGAGGIDFDMVGYAATMDQDIEWTRIAQRWTEFQNGTTGNDRFPAYTLTETRSSTPFVDGLDTDLDSVKVINVSAAYAVPFHGAANRGYMEAYDAQGKYIDTTAAAGVLTLGLTPGDNTFALVVKGSPEPNLNSFVDFKSIKVHRRMTLTIASTELNGAPVAVAGAKNKPYTFVAKSARPVPKDGKVRYDWTFSDNPGATISVNNDSTTTHQFAQEGTHTVRVTFFYGGTNISYVSATATITTPPPQITSIVPNNGKVGDTVKVKGKDFGSDQTKGSLTFSSGVKATGILSWVDTLITTKVPQGIQTGPVTVTVNGLTSNAVTFSLPPPSITSIVPNAGKVGDTVKVQGKNLGSDQTKGTMTFNSGIEATGILSWADTLIVLKVPIGAQSGSVTVTVNSIMSNALTFTIAGVPVITGLTPNSARINDTISIDGNYFGTDKSKGSVSFTGGAAYIIVSWSDTKIRVQVPEYAVTGPLTVTVNGVKSNGVLFSLDTSPWIDQVTFYKDGITKWGFPGGLINVKGKSLGSGMGSLLLNNLVVQPSTWSTSFAIGTIPAPTDGAVNVSVKTATGVSSNTKPAFIGFPLDTLRKYPRLGISISLYVRANLGGGKYLNSTCSFSGTANVTYGTDGYTIDASSISTTKTGTLKVTLSPGNSIITRLELNYVNQQGDRESVQYAAEGITPRTTVNAGYDILQFYVWGDGAVNSVTKQLTGTFSPSPYQTTYPIEGLTPGINSSIIISLWDFSLN